MRQPAGSPLAYTAWFTANASNWQQQEQEQEQDVHEGRGDMQ
jgi:hypothetical protein